MLAYDLARAGFRRLLKGERGFRPRCHDHARLPFLDQPHRSGDNISHAVDKLHTAFRAFVKRYPCRVFGDKFRFCRHYRPAGCRLRHFVPGAYPVGFAFYSRQDQVFSKAFYQRGFTGPYRAHHADIYIAARSDGNIAVYTRVCQNKNLRFVLLEVYSHRRFSIPRGAKIS